MSDNRADPTAPSVWLFVGLLAVAAGALVFSDLVGSPMSPQARTAFSVLVVVLPLVIMGYAIGRRRARTTIAAFMIAVVLAAVAVQFSGWRVSARELGLVLVLLIVPTISKLVGNR